MKILIRNHKHEKWEIVQSSPYQAETELQRILAEEPSLISIEEVRADSGVLVTAVQEFPLETGYIDVLGFTAEGDIAIIECKLATNLEIRRQVIGQVLDYGANLWRMDYEILDAKVFQRSGKNLVELVREAVQDPNWDEESFRSSILNALEAGNFILVIVVDEINEELNRIIHFINNSGNLSFSFAALEMQRYSHGQAEMLVPHVFGTIPPQKSSVSRGKKNKWDESTFFAELTQKHPDCVEPARKILEWSSRHRKLTRVWWGNGSVMGCFVPVIDIGGKTYQLFALWTYGILETYFQVYTKKAPFESIEKRRELLDRLNKIDGVNLPDDAINKRPGIPLAVLNDPNALTNLLETYDWFIDEILTYWS